MFVTIGGSCMVGRVTFVPPPVPSTCAYSAFFSPLSSQAWTAATSRSVFPLRREADELAEKQHEVRAGCDDVVG